MKIAKLEIENVKRVRAVTLEPAENGLTVIGGNNGQGKTSVLDAIAWALGGDKYRPSNPTREGSVIPPYLHVEMDNGLIVERRGEKSALKVTDPSGRKGGQQLLNEFVEQLALDLPRFMAASNKDKAQTLLKIIGVEKELAELEYKIQTTYNRRLELGRIALQKKKFADELPMYPDAPKEPISASELILKQQDILARNGENQRLRSALEQLKGQREVLRNKIDDLNVKLTELNRQLEETESRIAVGEKTTAELVDESTDEIRESLVNIEAINAKVAANCQREKAEIEAVQYQKEYDSLSDEIDSLREAKVELLTGAKLPLPGLSVEDGELTYNGQKWDCMSSAEQLRIATAIVRCLNPDCGFVLIDKLEQMDIDTMREFGEWLEAEGLQAIATRVSTGDECSIIISDGMAKIKNEPEVKAPAWTEGVF